MTQKTDPAKMTIIAWAGLSRTWQDFPADVEDAIRGADGVRTGFSRPTDPGIEPAGAGIRVPVANVRKGGA